MFAFEFHLVPVFVSSSFVQFSTCYHPSGFHLIFVRIYCIVRFSIWIPNNPNSLHTTCPTLITFKVLNFLPGSKILPHNLNQVRMSYLLNKHMYRNQSKKNWNLPERKKVKINVSSEWSTYFLKVLKIE